MRTIHFYEDDFGRCEILSLTAQKQCLEQMKQICGFDEEHRTPYGFTDVYVIDHSKMQPLSSLGLTQERIADALAFLPPFDQIISHSCYFPGIEMQARGTKQIALFWQADPAGLIKDLWLKPCWTRGESDQQLLERILKTLGALAPVLLADWERLCCVDLTQEEALDRYLQIVLNE